MKLTTNKGKLFDWLLNSRVNLGLWFHHIDDDTDLATEYAAQVIRKWGLS